MCSAPTRRRRSWPCGPAQDDEAGAAKVAAALGHLPLALALAASVVAGQQRGGYAWYLDQLQTVPVDVALAGDDGEPYPPSVARAVLLSLHAVRAADRTGICTRVMEIMAGPVARPGFTASCCIPPGRREYWPAAGAW